MRNAVLIVCSITLFACGDIEEPDPLFSVEALQGDYTIAVLTRWDLGEGRTKVWSYPYLDGSLSISLNSGTMSYHVKTLDIFGGLSNEVDLNRKASDVVIKPDLDFDIPGTFLMRRKYISEEGFKATSSSVVLIWNGSMLEFRHYRPGVVYTLFWLKDTQ